MLLQPLGREGDASLVELHAPFLKLASALCGDLAEVKENLEVVVARQVQRVLSGWLRGVELPKNQQSLMKRSSAAKHAGGQVVLTHRSWIQRGGACEHPDLSTRPSTDLG